MRLSRWTLPAREIEQARGSLPENAVAKTNGNEGVTFHPPAGTGQEWLRRPFEFSGQLSLVSLLAQLEEEGYAQAREGDLFLPWHSVYQVTVVDEFADVLSLLGLPPIKTWRPALESQGGLQDEKFAIYIAGWITPEGQPVTGDLDLIGPVVKWKGQESLLTEKAWETVQRIEAFYQRSDQERSPDANRRSWAEIRRFALSAHANLSHFLKSTVVLTPEKLKLNLRKGEGGPNQLVEVIPEFEGAPSHWLDIFDRLDGVNSRYDVPDGDGMTQLVLSPEVQSVLREIKRMPGRRVTGARAEAFVTNPFALLGPDATKVVDPDQFETARDEAGISFSRFTPEVVRDSRGELVDVALNAIETLRGEIKTEQIRFGTSDELEKFIAKLGDRISQQAQCCFWHGYDFEILGDTEDHLEALRRALTEWEAPVIVGLADLLDLSFYSERIEGFGQEKPYFSPFIAQREHKSEWFPEEVVYGVTFEPEDGGEPVAVALDEGSIEAFEEALNSAEKSNADEFTFRGLPRPVPVKEGEQIVRSFRAAHEDVEKKRLNPNNLESIKSARVRKQLVAKSNVDAIDYEERRGTLALPTDLEVRLPRTLRPEFPLKPHQIEGLLWLQHLWSCSPRDCRGALLADDMGLGKTIQLLAFIARCLEENPQAEPFLIVAPVSLLENWKEEINKFFESDSLPVLALYGRALTSRRVPRESLGADVVEAGFDRLLVRDWVGNAKIVLTTYETLRDLEFSLARQKWSAVICDEAQKIKNPNAMVSRAAKKQKARFKIACTGTPVENTLTDLWCLFDFVQPGLLGALVSFGHKYKRPIEAETEEEKQRLDELRALIEPQKLRRMKKDVAKDLPEKLEPKDCRNLQISDHQREHYAKAVQEFRRKQSGRKGTGLEGPLGLLQYLKTLCTDPRPWGGPSENYESLAELEKHSPKLAWLLQELPKIEARGEKAIVFCEFRHLQRTLQRAIGERLGFTPDIINGDTSASAETANNRQHRIKAFQDKPGFGVILLSPLAVGFGLNIQGANHVIHFTRTWNPAKEDQATDRAYRIGQTRDVYVYYPVVTAPDFQTFDQKLDQLLDWKRGLSHDMLNGSGEILPNEFGGLEDVDGSKAFEAGE
jgi:SNF2-related domain/Helicase conserved C-terminal domain